MKKGFFASHAVCIVVLTASIGWAQAVHVPDTGDPAERICNPKSYTDLENGIVRDNVTGLEWVQDGNIMASRNPLFDNDDTTGDGLVNWQHAYDYVALLNAEEYLGHDDWRLPTLHELTTILDFGRWGPAIDPAFSAVANYYWSSAYSGITWYIRFNSGTSWFCNPALAVGYVRAVRGGPYVPSYTFVNNDDGTISDIDTGLMWPLCNYGQTWDGTQCAGGRRSRTWEQALAYVQELNAAEYLGYDDWRLPTVNELQSLIDYSLSGPATTFPNRGTSDMLSYWSSVTTSWLSDAAWAVSFNLGNVKAFTKDTYNFTSAVRGGPCRAEDDAPVLGDGPFVAAGLWPEVSTSQESPTYLVKNVSMLWTFSDDFTDCGEACTPSAEYSVAGSDSWEPLTVTGNVEYSYAYTALPIESLSNATTYAFRFTVTDCAGQSTHSSTYYFRTAVTDAPPVLTGGPFVAAGTWPRLATTAAGAFEVSDDFQALWTFSDDYASCAGVCRHIARYRNVADAGWDWIGLTPVSTDPAGTQYAYVTIPVGTDDLAPGTYMLQTVTWDCLQQTTWSRIYYFKVAASTGCNMVWYDGETQLGSVPTQETSRTETTV